MEKIVQKYDHFFRDRHEPRSMMGYAIEDDDYTYVGRGWWPLVEELCERVQKIDPDFKFVQIKEKFGALRIYFASDNYEQIVPIINEMEARSTAICEVCGKPGKPANPNGGWIKTRCEEHS